MSEMRKMDEEARHHVLIVEDEVGANALLAAYLLRKGYRVTTAENGTRGFSKFLGPERVSSTRRKHPAGKVSKKEFCNYM